MTRLNPFFYIRDGRASARHAYVPLQAEAPPPSLSRTCMYRVFTVYSISSMPWPTLPVTQNTSTHSISPGSEKKPRITASRLEAPFIETGTALSRRWCLKTTDESKNGEVLKHLIMAHPYQSHVFTSINFPPSALYLSSQTQQPRLVCALRSRAVAAVKQSTGTVIKDSSLLSPSLTR